MSDTLSAFLWINLWSANETFSNENGFFFHWCPVKIFIILLFQSISVFLAFLPFKRIVFTYFPLAESVDLACFYLYEANIYPNPRWFQNNRIAVVQKWRWKSRNAKVLEISSYSFMKCEGDTKCLCLLKWAEEQALILVQKPPRLIHLQTYKLCHIISKQRPTSLSFSFTFI